MQNERIFINRSKPIITYALMAVNVAFFVAELALQAFGVSRTRALLLLGAKENTLITCGQYWRLITACFLHANLIHIASNLVGLFFWGPQVEKVLGRTRYLIVYLTAGLFGSLLSYVCSDGLSVGASGALFGLFGSLLYIALRYRQIFNQVIGPSLLILVGVNLVIGFLNPGIDNFGHIGGLIGGFCASWCCRLLLERPRAVQVLAALLLALVAAALFVFGIWKYSARLGIPMFSFIDVAY